MATAGHLGWARAGLRRLGVQASRLDQPRPLGLFGHAHGVLLAVDGDPAAGAARLAAAGRGLAGVGLRPDAARCLLDEGRARWRAGQRSRGRDALGAACHQFEAMGADRWAALAAAELERMTPGGTTTRQLTQTEASIAALVAAGARNREISSELFIALATVEAHLTRMYRKLHIRSRTELARLVADGEVDLGDGGQRSRA